MWALHLRNWDWPIWGVTEHVKQKVMKSEQGRDWGWVRWVYINQWLLLWICHFFYQNLYQIIIPIPYLLYWTLSNRGRNVKESLPDDRKITADFDTILKQKMNGLSFCTICSFFYSNILSTVIFRMAIIIFIFPTHWIISSISSVI